MKINDVPQDDSVLEGRRRACYAEDDRGAYVVVPSRGWEVERIVNEHARAALAEALETARRAVLAGRLSPLAYHMTAGQMGARLLAANAGVSWWRVRRHLRPKVFARLSRDTLERYAQALGLSVEDLTRVPETAS